MRVMGVDPGSRRIGLALSDEERVLASPLGVVEGGSGDAAVERVAEQARAHEVQTIVVGLPLRLDGSEGQAARRARDFSRRLEARGFRVVLWDERLSTLAAERALSEGAVRARKRRALVDKVAAAWLLQGYLDAESSSGVDAS